MRIRLKAIFVAALLVALSTCYALYRPVGVGMMAPHLEGTSQIRIDPLATITPLSPPNAEAILEASRPNPDPRDPTANPQPETVDSVLKKLVVGAVAFNVPSRMRVAHSQTLEARLGVNVPREQLVREITSEGEVKTAQLRVTPRMQATLSGGSAFDISPSGPRIQFVSNEETNTWHWEVTPKLEGQHMLVLTFDAFIEVGGKEGTHTVNTLVQRIVIEVGWPETAREWAEWFKRWVEYGGWLWTALLLPIGLFVLREWRKFRAKPAVAAAPVDDAKT